MSMTPNIYRHFRGGYYIVLSEACVESTGEPVVIYQSLQDGRVWTRPVAEFLEPVPEDKDNPTGQTNRFEKVGNFNNQLSMIPTERLVKELLSRPDCPVELQSEVNVWRTEYAVGKYIERFIDIDNTSEDFAISNIFNERDKAISYVQDRCLDAEILKIVYIKQDFD